MDEQKPEPEYTFDFNEMQTTNNVVAMHQEGNFLVCRTEKGVTFRQGIPHGKMLNKNAKGDWILQSIEVK